MYPQKKKRPRNRAKTRSAESSRPINAAFASLAGSSGGISALGLLLALTFTAPALGSEEGQLATYQRSVFDQAGFAFRRGEYGAAAELYRKAEQAGHPDPVLFYNLGVASYRMERYDEAESAFATAAAHDALAPMSYYNLGLVALRREEPREAQGWFRQAALHPEASPRLKRLSRSALASLPPLKREKPVLYTRDETRLKDFLRFSFDAGYGQDSNVFRAPKESYVDLAQAGTPTVEPVVQSGSFVPLDADLEFRWAPFQHSHFSIRYDFDGKVYTKAEHKNANAFRNRFSIGGRAYIPRDNGYRYFRSFFSITRMDENYYDRTDGQDQFIGTVDISDRFKRTRFGPHVYYHSERGRLGYGFSAEAFINKYDNDFEDELAFLDLTHEQYQVGAHVSFDVLKHTALRVSYDRYRRDYTQRKARSESGIRFSDNDRLQYDYHEAGARVRQELGRRLDLSVSYDYTIRTDNFEGYDDYRRHAAMAELGFDSRRFDADVGVVFQSFDFPNGFAFDVPAGGEKDLNRTFTYVEASYRIRPRYAVMLTAEIDLVESSDPRTSYDRNQIALGMRWSL
jgi:tetratricopeptide (TPR) repeat protein